MTQRLNGLLVQVKQAEARKRQLSESTGKNVLLASELLQRSQLEVNTGRQLGRQLNEANASFEQLRSLVNVSLQTMDKVAALEKELAKDKITIASLQSKIRTVEEQNSELKRKVEVKDTHVSQLARKLSENEEVQQRKEEAQQKKDKHTMNKLKKKLKDIISKVKSLKQDSSALQEDTKNGLDAFKREQMSCLRQVKDKLESQKLQRQKQQELKTQIYQTCSSVSQYTDIKRFPKESLAKQLPIFSQQLMRVLSASHFLAESQVIAQSQKYWLLDQLRQNLTCSNRVSSRLIYRFNEREENKVNFHKYVDGRPNLLVLVKISSGIIVGAFTEYPFIRGHSENPGNGFLFNVSRQVAYPMRNDAPQPVAVYDDYFLVFGNSEFRLRSLQLKLFSNFGIGTSTFNTKGLKRIDFMGSGQTEIDLIEYQIHEFMP